MSKRIVYNKSTRTFSIDVIRIASVSRFKKDFIDPSLTPSDEEYVSPNDLSKVFKGLPGNLPIYTSDSGPGSSGKFKFIKSYVESNGKHIGEVRNIGESTGPGVSGYGNAGFGNRYDTYMVGNKECYVGTLIIEEYDTEFVVAPKSIIVKALGVSTNDIEVIRYDII